MIGAGRSVLFGAVLALAQTAPGCAVQYRSDAAQPQSSGGEDGDGWTKRMPEGPTSARTSSEAGRPSGADHRPQLAEPPQASASGADGEAAEGAPRWGPPDAQSGQALPPRPKPNRAAREAMKEGVAAAAAAKPDLRAAKTAFERALAEDPRAYEAAYNLGIVAERQLDSKAALAAYARAVTIQPDYEAAVSASVRIHVRRGDPKRALALVRPLAKKWQRNLALQVILAQTLLELDRLDEAEGVARATLSRDERFAPALVVLAVAAMRRERAELADSILAQALAIASKDADVHFFIGRRHQQEGRLAQAVAEYQRAIKLRPDYCEARTALGLQYMAAGNYAQALREFERVVQLAPEIPAARLNFGDALRANRSWKKARTALEQARDVHKLPEAHYDLALLYMDAGADYPGLSLLETLQLARAEFTAYRKQLGAALAKDDPSANYIADLERQIERERKRVERDQARKPSAKEAKP